MNSRRISAELELRPVEPSHAQQLFAVIDRNRAHLRRWLPWVDATKSIDDEQAFITRDLARRKTDGAFHCAIFENGALVGGIGLHSIDPPNRKAEIGYWLDEAHQGKGIITRACRDLVTHLFSDMNLHRVSIYCGVENHRSRAVPQRLGFWQEGIHRDAEWVNDHFIDLVCYAMLKPTWNR